MTRQGALGSWRSGQRLASDAVAVLVEPVPIVGRSAGGLEKGLRSFPSLEVAAVAIWAGGVVRQIWRG